MRKIGLTIILVLVATIANAASSDKDKELAKCAVIEFDFARLECFDKLVKSKKLNRRQLQTTSIKGKGKLEKDEGLDAVLEQLQATSITGKGKWRVTVDTNPIDDSKSVFLFLDADSGTSRWGKEITLIARCKSNTTAVYITWNDYLGSEANGVHPYNWTDRLKN